MKLERDLAFSFKWIVYTKMKILKYHLVMLFENHMTFFLQWNMRGFFEECFHFTIVLVSYNNTDTMKVDGDWVCLAPKCQKSTIKVS